MFSLPSSRLLPARLTAFSSRNLVAKTLFSVAAASLSACLLMTGCGSGTSTPSTPTAATPTFSPAGGSFTTGQSVTLADTTPGATIHYTLDGTTPSASSATYSAALTVASTTTINAIAVAPSYNNSAVGTASYTILPPPAAAPAFAPAPGIYTSAQAVTLTDATAGASIYYTLDGSAPSTSSAKYAGAITVASTMTINTIAVAAGFSNSAVSSGLFTINLPTAAAPSFSPAAGTFTSAQTVSLADAMPGATIYYTVDGTTPTTNSARYSAPINVGATETINTLAAAPGYLNSPVVTGVFTINLPPAATPTFSPAAGTFTAAQTVTLADATTGATIYYTLDGSTPTTASARYVAPISVTSTETIKALATASGYTTSAIAAGVFTINLPPAATPTFSPAPGTFTTAQTVSLVDATVGAVIYYTVDGSTPTTASPVYTAPINVATTTTIRAMAQAPSYVNSAVATGAFVINLAPAATPSFSPAPGTFNSAQTVALSDASPGAAIYYTIDGSVPTTASARYTTPISVASTTTINAIATASGFNQSAVATGVFTINLPAAATPTFSTAAGTFTTSQTIGLADATAGATIYYTLNGSTPTTASTVYTTPISVTSTETINAIATASGYNTSAVGSATYTINLPTAATPSFSPAAGTYTTAQSVTLSDATTGATIYYTVDGSTPTTASTVYASPIAVGATETVKAIATAPGAVQSATASALYTINLPTQSVTVVQSIYDSSQLLAPQNAVAFGNSPASGDQLYVDENQQYQTIEGFGASFTDSAAYLLEQVAQPSQLSGALNDLFTRTGSGIGLSFMRQPMGAADLSRSAYSYDDLPAGGTDNSLTSFSIAHDQSSILPLILSAKQLNPQMKLMGSPWSAPAWMKTTSSLEGGMIATPYYTQFANYFIKYLQAYKAAGILPDYISLQNEPLFNTTQYPSVYMDSPTQLTILRDYVIPALAASNLSTKILIYDHNWDVPSYPTGILLDPVVLASPLVAGTAWHGYFGPAGAMQGVQNEFPTKGQWETEHSGGNFGTNSNQFTSDLSEITLVMRNAGKSYVKWSLALDQNHGPNLSQLGTPYGGCSTCNPIVTVNSNTGAITKTIEYYTLGQFSKYVLPGAIRVWSSDTPTVVSSAYINPDNTRVLVAFNNSFSPSPFQVQWGTQNFSYTLPAYAAATFIWTGTQTGVPAQDAKQQIQGASYSTQNGLEVEPNTDLTGSYDLGYVTDGATVFYKNVNFGTAVSSVDVRVASNGNGGTIEFHLDSPTGKLIGTAPLKNTGGYQAWVDVTAPVTGASGLHDLYMVIHGSGGIGNVNYFQFQ